MLGTVLSALSAVPAAADGLALSLDKAVYVAKDEVELTLTGAPGEPAYLLFALQAGTTDVPGVGTFDLQLDATSLLIELGPIPSSGSLVLYAQFGCSPDREGTYYLQGLSADPTRGFCISNLAVLEVDFTLSPDCNTNGIPDACEDFTDCNGNLLPDECDIASGESRDDNMDGVPDECQPELVCLEDAVADPECSTSSYSHAFWFQGCGLGKNWSNMGDLMMETFPDGTARITGTVFNRDDLGQEFAVDLLLGGLIEPGDPSHPPTNSPKTDSLDSDALASNGGPIDPTTWSYYMDLSGTLVGLGDLDGAAFSVSRVGPAVQVGVGADLHTCELGLASWLQLDLLSQPNQGPTLPDQCGGSDVNVRIQQCPADPVPVVHYDFGSQAGTTVVDREGSCDLTLVSGNSDLQWMDDGLRQGLLVDQGSNGTASARTLDAADADDLRDALVASDAMTVQVFFEQIDNEGNDARLLSYGSATAVSERNFTLIADAQGAGVNDARFRIDTTSGTFNQGVSPAPWSAGVPTVFTATYSADLERVLLYVNGSPIGLFEHTGDLDSWISRPLVLANENSDDRPFAGTLFDVKVWDRALSPLEVAVEAALLPR